MALKLDILKDVKNKNSFRSFSYADLHLDIDLDAKTPNKPTGASKNKQDLKIDYDEKAIYNSIRNIFNTKKGQKILNPTFGLDLEQYLFENVSKENGQTIGQTIYEELALYEPRIVVNEVCKAFSGISPNVGWTQNQPWYSYLTSANVLSNNNIV